MRLKYYIMFGPGHGAVRPLQTVPFPEIQPAFPGSYGLSEGRGQQAKEEERHT